ncbi:MAG: bifunctional diaminohydroxyphosphoribosylaminopyrimidine deaminase/5-amino-6-(5-phosphoribosylamino)uracil reductase RibD [Candidatus Sericytochromatia bacterium]|nr:bifunctional diaminohydroxyphosphoribosylaminopyrimidine deaminase/5-amino-6-(5-phosphoribosylamino)uracil reductase RibD [Candidatus Sericytochromatia bacterium]
MPTQTLHPAPQGADADERFMARALELAWQGRGWTSPNPMVGAVVVRDGHIVGEGFHPQAGKPHAEVFALDAAGDDARGATLYVTLEPCAHHGRTPPCVERVLAAGVRRVVAAVVDPNPLVAGRGMAALEAAGVEVAVGVLGQEAATANERFFKYIRTKRPFVAIKTGMSLDGKIATASGESQWITNDHSRGHVQILRATYDAVMVGVNTVVQDNPRLTCRISGGRQPVRIIIDSMARTPLNANLFAKPAGTSALRSNTIVCVGSKAPDERVRALREMGAEILLCHDAGFSSDTHIDLAKLMVTLGKREITSILLEGGGTLNAAALEAGIVDKVYVYVAPKLIGGVGAPTMVEGSGVTLLEEAVQLHRLTATEMGGDILLEAYTQPE